MGTCSGAIPNNWKVANTRASRTSGEAEDWKSNTWETWLKTTEQLRMSLTS